MSFILYTTKEGRYYVNGKWVGNYYLDKNGNKRDTKTNVILNGKEN